MERSCNLFSPEQFAILQEAFDKAWSEISHDGVNVTRDDLARNMLAVADGFEGDAHELSKKVLEGLRQHSRV